MKKSVLKIFLIFLILLSVVPISSALEERNIYEGISAASYDEISTKKYSVQTNGAIDISEKGGTLIYKNLNFYKDVSHIEITYATGTFVNPRRLKVFLDGTESENEIAYFILEETGNVNNYRSSVCEIKSDIKGKHDLYISDENGSSARIKSIKFLGKWDPQTNNAESYPEEIHVLSALGIADYSYINEDNRDSFITRREFSKMLSSLFKIKGISNSSFYDVKKDDPDILSMAAVYAIGALEVKDGFFYPDRGVTYKEVYKAILKTAGYKRKVDSKYNGSYTAQAADLKINSKIKANENECVSFSDAIIIMGNALFMTLPLVSYPDLDFIYNPSSDNTVISMIHEVKKASGIVNGNSKTYLTRNTDTTSPFQVLIGDKFYNEGSSGAGEYLGYNITFYYKEINGNNTVIAAYINKNINKTKIIQSEWIKDFYNNELSYRENDNDKKISFSNKADILFNGVSYPQYKKEDFILEEGYITFIDNNEDGKYDVVDIVSGRNFVVDSVDTVNGIVTLVDNGEKNARVSILTSDDLVLNLGIFFDGNRATVNDIESGDILTVYDSKLIDGKITNSTIRVSKNHIEDLIKETYTVENKSFIITQSDKKYQLTQNCNSDITVGTSYIIYVNENGKAVYLKKGKIRDYKYGYVMNAGIIENGFDTSFSFKILTEESEIKIFSCNDKLIYDGETLSGYKKQEAYILSSGERYAPQVVRYKTNSSGKITFVDTYISSAKEDKENSLVKNLAHNAGEYKQNSGYFWKITPIDDNTIVFVTPLYYQNAVEMIDSCDDEDFYTTNAKQFGGMSSYSEGYDGSFSEPLKAMITYKMNRNDFQETSPVIYITDVSVTIDRKGNQTKKITGISKGQIVKLILNSEANELYGDKMEEGDLWLYNLDLKNEVTFLVPLWSKDGTDYESTYPLHQRPLDKTNLYIMYANSINKHNGKYFEVNVNGEKCGFSFDGASVMVYDKTTGKVNSVSPENLITNDQAAAAGFNQYAFIYAYQKEVTQVIVVRE